MGIIIGAPAGIAQLHVLVGTRVLKSVHLAQPDYTDYSPTASQVQYYLGTSGTYNYYQVSTCMATREILGLAREKKKANHTGQ